METMTVRDWQEAAWWAVLVLAWLALGVER